MDIQHFKQKLLDKEGELNEEIAGLKSGATDNDPVDVRDSTDTAEVDLESSQALDEATALTHTLEEVRDALQRVADGSYGKCLDCGREIEPARLEAVPWARYCREHQERRDARAHVAQGSTL